MTQMTCNTCNIDLIPVQRTKGFSVVGLLSAGGFLAGLALMLYSFGLGVVVVIAAILIGTLARGKDTYLVCPKCKKETGPI